MLLKIVLVGIAVTLINIFLKKKMNEFVLPVEIVFLTFAVMLLAEYLRDIFSTLSGALSQTEYGEEIFTSAVKGAGICLITKFSSDISYESGSSLIGDVIELAGRLMLAVIAMPYIESLINIALAFLK